MQQNNLIYSSIPPPLVILIIWKGNQWPLKMLYKTYFMIISTHFRVLNNRKKLVRFCLAISTVKIDYVNTPTSNLFPPTCVLARKLAFYRPVPRS